MTDKAAVFIDLGYFSKSLKDEFDSVRVDLLKFSNKICGDCERFRTYVYDCDPFQDPSPSVEQKVRKANADRFHHVLKMLPRFEVRLGRLARRMDAQGAPKYEQKGTDTQLSVDLVELCYKGIIGRAMLVTGDSDFVPAVVAAKNVGVIVEIHYYGGTHVSDELLEVCDGRFIINKEIIESCSMG